MEVNLPGTISVNHIEPIPPSIDINLIIAVDLVFMQQLLIKMLVYKIRSWEIVLNRKIKSLNLFIYQLLLRTSGFPFRVPLVT